MLELRGVTKRYSGIAAVQNVSFMARAGEVTGYLGPNGSGKSTTLKMITGPDRAHRGRDPLSTANRSTATRSRIASSSAMSPKSRTSIRISPAPSTWRWWASCAACRERALAEKIEGFLRLLSLHQDRYVPISSYSKGMRQKVLLIAALLAQSRSGAARRAVLRARRELRAGARAT